MCFVWFDYFSTPYSYIVVFLCVGLIGMAPNAFWCHLHNNVVFGDFESLIRDFCGNLSIHATDGRTDGAIRSKTSILRL